MTANGKTDLCGTGAGTPQFGLTNQLHIIWCATGVSLGDLADQMTR